MTETAPPTAETLTKLHVLTFLNWEREGARTFEASRVELLDTLDAFITLMESNEEVQAIRYFMLGGQTVILEDLAQVRPNLLSLLVIYNAGGKLGVGPFYTQVDGMLSSGEAILRDLLIGQADSKRHGLKGSHVAYLSRTAQYSSQFPQILRGFGVDSVLLSFHENVMPLPFVWQSPDGSTVLVNHYRSKASPKDAVAHQQNAQPDGPFLWMHPFNTAHATAPKITPDLGMPIRQSTLHEFIEALRESLPDGLRPTLKGEAYVLDNGYQRGRFTARIHLKQANMRLQARLTHYAEPLLAIASTHGTLVAPANAQALLDYSWRLLLQSQTPETIGGLGLDNVEENTHSRHQRVQTTTDALIQKALTALGTSPLRTIAPTEKTSITVWNPHGRPVKGIVEVALRLPSESYPQTLRAPNGEDVAFTWDEETQHIGFLAEAQSVGYRTYTLELSKERTSDYHKPQRKKASSVSDGDSMALAVEGDKLVWTWGDGKISDLLTFYDDGDAGSTESYLPPFEDVVVQATLTDNIYTQSTPTYEQLVLNHRLRIAPNLENGKRGRGLRALDITTRATFFYHLKRLHLQTEFVNNAHDHRLRAYFNTGKKAEKLWVGTPFDLQERAVALAQVMQGVGAIQDKQGVFALYSNSTPLYEALPQADHTTLALTLLRAVSYSDGARHTRADGAQCQRAYQHQFWLTHEKAFSQSEMLHTSQLLNAPLYGVQTDIAPAKAEQSYLTLSDDRALMTALKPPQEGDGWIVRLVNPTSDVVETHLSPLSVGDTLRLQQASLVNMNETHDKPLAVQGDTVRVTLAPKQIVTVKIGFKV